jgi:hypothetical protein
MYVHFEVFSTTEESLQILSLPKTIGALLVPLDLFEISTRRIFRKSTTGIVSIPCPATFFHRVQLAKNHLHQTAPEDGHEFLAMKGATRYDVQALTV